MPCKLSWLFQKTHNFGWLKWMSHENKISHNTAEFSHRFMTTKITEREPKSYNWSLISWEVLEDTTMWLKSYIQILTVVILSVLYTVEKRMSYVETTCPCLTYCHQLNMSDFHKILNSYMRVLGK
jgi:hypothetical protein